MKQGLVPRPAIDVSIAGRGTIYRIAQVNKC